MSKEPVGCEYFLGMKSGDALSREEEARLARLIAEGDEEAKKTFIEANLKLVVHVVRRFFSGVDVPEGDLIQEGNIGLMHAVELFDPTRGCKFSTYAIWWIRQAIIRYLNNNTFVRLPHYVKQEVNRVFRSAQRLGVVDLHNKDSLKKVVDEMNRLYVKGDETRYRVEDILILLHEAELVCPRSLDITFPDSKHGLFDTVADASSENPYEAAEKESARHTINRILDELPPKERLVVVKRFGLDGHEPCTLHEVGEMLGVSRERVRQVESRALRILRGKLALHIF